MTDPDEKTRKAFERLAAKLSESIPEIGEIFERVKSEELSPEDAMRLVSTTLMQRPDLMGKFQSVVQTGALMGEVAETPEDALAKIPKQASKSMAEYGMTPDNLLYTDDEGRLRLNPMYEVAIQERLQFDGDIPELRMGGDIPEGGYPAVPVKTDTTNPVALGMMLSKAREEVEEELKTIKKRREDALDAAMMDLTTAALTDPALADLSLEGVEPDEAIQLCKQAESTETTLARVKSEEALAELHKPLDVPGYKRGHLPVMREVEAPTMTEVVSLPRKKQAEYAWLAISTTQGRRSSIPGMGRRLAEGFQRAKYRVEHVDQWTSRPAVATADWSISILGFGNMNAAYSPISQAQGVLSSKLLKQLKEGNVLKDRPLELELKSLNDYSQRRVGWKARIVLAETKEKALADPA